MKSKFTFKAELWLYPGMAGNWHFISLPKKDAIEVRGFFGVLSRGWGSLRVEACIGKTSWKTSIFPDKKRGTYLLPVKAEIRKREGVEAGDKVPVQIEIIK